MKRHSLRLKIGLTAVLPVEEGNASAACVSVAEETDNEEGDSVGVSSADDGSSAK